MDSKPHDTFAKKVLGKLARGREIIVEAELPAKVYADVFLRPGPPLPSWVGLLGRLVQTGLTVIEIYHGLPLPVDLCHARAKGALALGVELKRNRDFPGAAESRVLLLTGGTPHTALARCFDGEWHEVDTGYTEYKGAVWYVHLDLKRLRVTKDTAWAHVAGGSPRLDEAIALLLASGEREPQRLLYELSEEVSIMPELQKRDGDRVEQSGAYRFAKAWELALSRREGLQRGRQEGLHEGLRRGLRRGLQKGREEGRKEGREEGRDYGKLQSLENLLGLPETPLEALAAMPREEIERRIDELTRRVRARIS